MLSSNHHQPSSITEYPKRDIGACAFILDETGQAMPPAFKQTNLSAVEHQLLPIKLSSPLHQVTTEMNMTYFAHIFFIACISLCYIYTYIIIVFFHFLNFFFINRSNNRRRKVTQNIPLIWFLTDVFNKKNLAEQALIATEAKYRYYTPGSMCRVGGKPPHRGAFTVSHLITTKSKLTTMNTAVLQGSIMATSHGISRINRHIKNVRSYYINPADRLGARIKKRSPIDDSPSTDEEVSSKALLPTDVRHQKGIVTESAKSNEFLRLNVGGHKFMLRKETIISRKVGRLLWLLELSLPDRLTLADAFFESTNEYYFERPPQLFHVIYQFYLTGLIHQPSHLCPMDILDEFQYWGIVPDNYLAPCCCADDKMMIIIHYNTANEGSRFQGDNDSISSYSSEEAPNLFKHLWLGDLRRTVWNVIEEPTSCFVYEDEIHIFVVIVIALSGLIVDMEPHPILSYTEYVCIIWFTLEYGLKMLVSSDRRKTFFQLLNIIDLMAIVPFIIEMTLFLFGVSTEQLRDLKGAFLVIRILRVLRVIRVLKLGRYSSGLQMFGKTLKASFRQLGMMAMVVLTGVIFFSTLVYFLEKDEPGSQFYSIPAACWWIRRSHANYSSPMAFDATEIRQLGMKKPATEDTIC
uniref:BTB domain-containing protein n=1 Tax=Heterorhabditis bacteriophora TaxID=37862 RepID=A0A1I7X2Q0_HETBA